MSCCVHTWSYLNICILNDMYIMLTGSDRWGIMHIIIECFESTNVLKNEKKNLKKPVHISSKTFPFTLD